MKATIVINTSGTEKRIGYLEKILDSQSSYTNVGEIIVVIDNANKVGNAKSHRNVRIVSVGKNIGPCGRWIGGLLADGQCVIMQDDDLILSQGSIDILINSHLVNPNRLHGFWGRNFNADHTYNLGDVWAGDCDFLSTRAVCMNKSILPYVLEFQNRIFGKFPSTKDFMAEDILLSLISEHIWQYPPNAIPATSYKELDEDSERLHDMTDLKEHRAFWAILIKKELGKNVANIRVE